MSEATELPTIGHNSQARTLHIDMPNVMDWVRIHGEEFLHRKNELLMGFARWATQPITDDVMQGKSADFIKQIAATIKQIEAARAEVKAPVLDLARAIDGTYKGLTDPLADAKATIERAMTAYAKQRAAEELARAKAEAERLAAAQAEAAALAAAEAEMLGETPVDAPEPVQAALPTMADASRVSGDYGSTASLRGRWTYEVEGAALIPRHLLMVNDAAVKAAIKAGERKIPGIRIYQETKIGVR